MVDIRTVTIPVEQQETITKDSVTVRIDAVLWYQIIDPVPAIIKIADYRLAVHQVALTSLRNIVGQHVLDEVLRERDTINHTLRRIVDNTTKPWGIRVEIIKPTNFSPLIFRVAKELFVWPYLEWIDL